jgi:hypothetical protein
MTRMFIVAMISTIVSAPFALSVQYLVATVLSRETINQKEAEKEKQEIHLKRQQRVLSHRQKSTVARSDLMERCGGSSDEDYNNLQRELSEYYQELLKLKEKTVAEEFRGE